MRDFVETRLGSPVVRAVSQGAGFTPGFASRLIGADGSRLFVKAASKKAQKAVAEAYAEEARILGELPPDLPATRILWSNEDDSWVVLGFEDVEGRQPRRPWRQGERQGELEACLTALAEVSAADPPAGLRPVHVELPALVNGWQHVWRTQPDWPHLSEAAGLASALPDLPDAGCLMHCDARDDNFILAADGRAVLCDWNWPATGQPWLDAVALLISVHGDGGDAEAVLSSFALTRDVAPDHVDTWLAAYTGFMLEARDRPVPPTSPYLRIHQGWYADAGWSWLAQRRGWS